MKHEEVCPHCNILTSKQNKGKLAGKVQTATDELNFNKSISLAMAKTLEQSSDLFISMVKVTLARRYANLAHVRSGIKPDTLSLRRTAPCHMATLFPKNALKKAKEDIASYESEGHSSSCSNKKGRYHLYERPKKSHHSSKSDKQAWKTIGSPLVMGESTRAS